MGGLGGEALHTVFLIARREFLTRVRSRFFLISGDPTAPKVEFKDQLDPTVAAALDGLVKQVAFEQALVGSGVDPATIEAKGAPPRFQPVALDSNAAQRSQRIVVGMFVAALLFTALQLYGGFVASGVVE